MHCHLQQIPQASTIPMHALCDRCHLLKLQTLYVAFRQMATTPAHSKLEYKRYCVAYIILHRYAYSIRASGSTTKWFALHKQHVAQQELDTSSHNQGCVISRLYTPVVACWPWICFLLANGKDRAKIDWYQMDHCFGKIKMRTNEMESLLHVHTGGQGESTPAPDGDGTSGASTSAPAQGSLWQRAFSDTPDWCVHGALLYSMPAL